MKTLLNNIIVLLDDVDNKTFNLQKNGVKTLLNMILDSNKLNIILEAELRNALSPVMLYAKLVKDINSHDEQLFEIFERAYSETLTNLNHFLNYTEKDREKYIASVQEGIK